MRVRIKTAVGAGLGSVPGDDIVPTTSRCYHVSAETHVSPGISRPVLYRSQHCCCSGDGQTTNPGAGHSESVHDWPFRRYSSFMVVFPLVTYWFVFNY